MENTPKDKMDNIVSGSNNLELKSAWENYKKGANDAVNRIVFLNLDLKAECVRLEESRAFYKKLYEQAMTRLGSE